MIPNYDVAALYDNETVAGNTTTLTNGYFSFNFAQPMPNTNFTVILTATQKKVGTILTNFLGNAYVDLRLPSEDTRAITVSSTTKVLYAGGVLSSGAFALGTNIISNSDANQTSSDAWVAAVDNTGAVMWLRGFGSPDGNEKVLGIAVDDSETAYGSGAGDVYVVGSFTSSSMDFDGTTLSNAGAVGVPDIFVARLDGRNGTTVWATRFGSAQADEALGVAVSIKSAHIYIVGYYSANIVFGSTTLQNAGNEDGFVVQLSTVDGAAGWAMRQYGSGIEILRGVAVDRSNTKDYGSVVVTGQYSSTSYYPGDGSAWGSRGSDDAIFFRYEYDTGKFMHGRAWGGTGSDVSMSIAIHPGTGNIYCTGTSTSTSVTYTGGFLDPITKSGTGRSIWVAKHDAYGNREWYKVFQGSGTGDDAAYAVQVDPMSEDVFVTGVIGSSGGITFGSTTVASRMYLLQMKKSGYVRRATGLPTSFNSIFNQAWALHVDRRSNVWVGGGGASVDGQGVGAQVTSTISAFAGAAFLGLHDDQLAAQTTPSEWTILGSGGWTSGKAEDKAFDGSLYTSVDTSANNSYFGLDLGRPRTLERIKWLCTQEELGLCGNTSFEVADDAAFNNAIQIHYWKLMPRRGWMYIDFRGLTAHRYFRVVPNDGQSGSHTVEVELYATEDEVLATGRVIGDGNVVWNGYLYDTDQSRAFDNNWDSYFESGANTAWTGIDVGFRTTLRRIRFLPRKSWESRMVGGKFQASNDHTFSTGVVDVYTITSPPMYYIYNEPTFTPKGPYRYFRYLTPTGGFGNVAEIEFYVDNNQTMSHYHVRIASATNLGQYCGAYYRQNAWDFDNTTYYEACSGTTNNYVGQDMHNPWRVVKVGVQPRTGYASRAAGAEFQVSYVEDFDAYSEIWNLAKVNSTPPENQVTYFDVSPVPYNAVPATRYPRWLAANNTLGGDPVELEFLVNPDVRQRSLESYCYSYGAFNWVAMCTTAPTDNMLQIELVPWETWMGGTSLAGGPWKRGQVVEATGASYKQTAKDRWFIVHFGDTIYAKMVLIHIYATGTWGQIYVVKADSGYTATMGSSPTAAQINAAWAQRAPHSDYYVTRAVIAHYGQQTGFAAVP